MKWSDINAESWLKYGFIIIFAIILVRLFWVQVLSHDFYKTQALNQQNKSEKISSRRGTIYSNDGYILATDLTTYKLIANPKIIKNSQEYIDSFTKILKFNSDEDRNIFRNKAKQFLESDTYYQILKRNLTYEERNEIEKLKLTGISFEKEIRRFYPEGKLLSHVLGFVAKSETEESVGYYGIEGKNNYLLKGREGRKDYQKGALGQKILYDGINTLNAIDGDSIKLTINRTIQYLAETNIQKAVIEHGAKSGQVIVMNPATGDVLAMASYPNFDPYDPYQEILEENQNFKPEIKNKNITDNFEPGSVLKPMTIASAYDLGLLNENSIFYDNGPITYSGKTIDNWDKKHLGALDPTLILQKSNNVATAQIGILVGENNLKNYFSNFGFGKGTLIDLEGEEKGLFRQNSKWEPIDTANISFGQGISATPLQVLTAFNVFANDGVLIRPRIIDEIMKANGEKTKMPINTEERVVSSKTNDFMNKILVKSTSSNEGKFFLIKNYNISGKTGTGQIFEKGEYVEGRTNATFVGYLTNSKKFSMLVRIEEPTSSTYASETAMPVWMSIATDLINYYNISPDF